MVNFWSNVEIFRIKAFLYFQKNFNFHFYGNYVCSFYDQLIIDLGIKFQVLHSITAVCISVNKQLFKDLYVGKKC